MPRARNKTASATTSSRSKPAGKTVDAVVLLDLYAWHDTFGDPDSPINEANKGDEITVDQHEFERAQNMAPMGLAKKGSREARRFLAGDVPTDAAKLAELTDDELRAVVSLRGVEDADEMNRDELLGAVFASPGGNERPQQP